MKLIQIKQKNLRIQRKKWLALNRMRCPILKQKIEYVDSVVDHKHITKKELREGKVGEDGKGCIRGVVQRQANAFEGKMHNAFKRLALGKFIELPDLLRNIADYIENPPLFNSGTLYIHPKEELKEIPRNLGKIETARVYKYWSILHPARKPPKMPKPRKGKKGKLKPPRVTKAWIIFIEEANVYHESLTGKRIKRK